MIILLIDEEKFIGALGDEVICAWSKVLDCSRLAAEEFNVVLSGSDQYLWSWSLLTVSVLLNPASTTNTSMHFYFNILGIYSLLRGIQNLNVFNVTFLHKIVLR